MKSQFRILLVEDMDSFRGAVAEMLGVYSSVTEADSLNAARKILESRSFDVVLLDKGLPDGSGIDLLSEIKASQPNTIVIILTSDADFTCVKQCITRGADDYVVKTDTVVSDLLVRIPLAVAKAASTRKLTSLEQTVRETFRYEILGKSPSTAELRESVAALKGSGAHVLIQGESGTGKELIARRLNSIEDDHARPFVAINCGAIPENLVESELFGHKKGAFTGALSDRPGKFELAHGGDLFLDEIGELPLMAQARLLRVLQEGEVSRVGDDRVLNVRCRVIAATNRDLQEMVTRKTFREDLYHRLNVIRIMTVPLRDRLEDVGDIARSFLLQVGGPNYKISDRALRILRAYDWPGNIRELRNCIERAVIASRRRGALEIREEDVTHFGLQDTVGQRSRKLQAFLPTAIEDLSSEHYLEFLETAEREYLRTALELSRGSVTEVSRRLGLARSTAFKKVRELEIPTTKIQSSVRLARRVTQGLATKLDHLLQSE